MADDAASATAEESQITFNVKSANDAKHVVTVSASLSVADLKTKLSTSEYADIPVERQRLIYSGRVLKDTDTLASAKIKDGHTVHLVKGAASNARQNPTNQGAGATTSGGSPAPQVPTNLATGTGNNPLAGLTGARYAGFHGLPGAETFGPDGGMGPPPDPEHLLEMMENPMFLSQMTEAMNNPHVIDMMCQNPMIRDNPMLTNMIRNPEMRRMMFNPEMMRMQLQMQRAMGRGGGGSSFPAPGVTDTTPQTGSTATGDGTTTTTNQPNTTGTTQTPQDPFAALLGQGMGGIGGGSGAANNPFAMLLDPNFQAAARAGTANRDATENTASTNPTPDPGTTSPPSQGQQNTSSPPNPFASLLNPEMNQRMMEEFQRLSTNQGGSGNQANPFAALLGGAGGNFGTPPPQDSRPPEEMYESQLRQLNEMGFHEFDRNVQALRRSGGNVHGAIEFLLSGS